jgi:hypothetical protein
MGYLWLAACVAVLAKPISVTTDAARSLSSWTWSVVQWRGWLSMTQKVPRAWPSASMSGDARVGDDPDVADGGVVAQQSVFAGVVDEERFAGRDGVLAEGMAERRPSLGGPRLR